MSSFPSIRIEGGLLGPELLDQVIAADVPGQKPADFGLEPKRNLTDEIAGARQELGRVPPTADRENPWGWETSRRQPWAKHLNRVLAFLGTALEMVPAM
jgi:hypothetical protein